MAESPLSFSKTNPNREILLAKNLAPYSVSGVWSNAATNYNSEVNFVSYSVIDSPNNYISQPPFITQNTRFNSYSPENGFSFNINYNNPPLPTKPNSGEYSPKETKMDILYEGEIDAAFNNNIYGPEDGYNLLVTIDDLQLNNKIYQPYWSPPIFTPSSYSAYQLYINPNAQGTNGPITDDSQLAQIGAVQLRDLFQTRVDTELLKSSLLRTNLDGFKSPFFAALQVLGTNPVVEPNYRITVPEGPLAKAFDFIGRVSGFYTPVSPIPGDYFSDSIFSDRVGSKSVRTLGLINRGLGGILGPIMNLFRNPSETFLSYTSNGQKSILFNNLNLNRYRPNYDYGFGGLRGILQTAVDAVSGADNSESSQNYLGNRTTDLAQITSPPNQVPVNSSGQQVQAPVYGPDLQANIFEGNEGRLNFGLAGKTLADGGSIDGGFVWVSPVYKGNAGFKAKQGGAAGSLDDDFNLIKSSYELNQSTNLTFKPGSILDNTQRLVDSGDKVQGGNRLKHVGNAINQVSKVFNDGYKEITKGSKVLSYVDNISNNEIITTGREVGVEYCRLFTKDTPYYTYGDLQKSDGITTFGRKFSYSVLDNTYNLNIAPQRLPDSTNIRTNNEGKFVAKKYMLSIENLAWRTSSRPGFTYDDLPLCERGPNGGRIMWFPPYDLKFNDTSTAQFQGTSFLGRPEPMYTYKETTRNGSLSFKIVVDHPSVVNTIIRKQLKGQTKDRVESIMNSFFAGCAKYDIYELAKKFNTIPLSDLVRFQMAIENPNASRESLERTSENIPRGNTNEEGKTEQQSAADFKNKYTDFALYFDNNVPGPNNSDTTTEQYETTYNQYIGQKNTYQTQSINLFSSNTIFCKKDATSLNTCQQNSGSSEFFTSVIEPAFTKLKDELVKDLFQILDASGTVDIEMVGSASAQGTSPYNQKLSQRRIDSFINYLKLQVSPTSGTKMSDYFDVKKTIKVVKSSAQGSSGTSTPKDGSGNAGTTINCNTQINGGSGSAEDKSNANVYSTSAMACRRILVTKINAKLPENQNKPGDEKGTTTTANDDKNEVGNLYKVQPRERRDPTAVTEGISKKILRNLFSECDYFDALKEESPMIYDSIKEKLKYFNPAFHSMTPEGLNSRLVFLNQCVRPGQTIPTIGADGRPKFNDAVNTSFGTPPVLILRIGDFYNTKIIPDSVSFTYDPLNFDMNPEGIGLQPMIANVTLSFKIIGGMGLAKPVEELQNALSFSYYANTEIYDERATPTDESFKILDKEILEALNNGKSQVSINDIQNNQTNGGGTTIGEVTSETPIAGGVQGEIKYDKVMDDLLKQTSDYFKVVVGQLESVTNTQNFGFTQILNFDRKFNLGTINTQALDDSTALEMQIYGKPEKWEEKVDEIYNKVIADVDNNNNPIIKELGKNFDITKPIYPMRQVKINLKNYIKSIKDKILTDVNTPMTTLVETEQKYIQNIRKLNAIVDKTDGRVSTQGTPVIYNLSGNPYNELVSDFGKLKATTDKYNNLLKSKNIAFKEAQTTYSLLTPIGGDSDKNFFLFMSRILTDENKKNAFVNFILGTPLSLLSEEQPVNLNNRTRAIVDDLAKNYNIELKKEKELFENLKKSAAYTQLVDGLEQEMYVTGKSRIFGYDTTPNPQTESLQKDIIFNLYRTTNVNNNRNTFDGKIEFK
jgi:outer membrane protein OmpA-like peptidoglycan-associated protein